MEGNTSDISELISNLVGIETENPPGNEQPCAKYIVDWFDERDINSELICEPYEDRPQVVSRIGDGDPVIVLNGHMDVVPAGDHSRWEYDPYGGKIEHSTLYGRGSADMKTGLAIAMQATADLSSEIESGDLDGSIIFHGIVGEETAEPGTKMLLEMGYEGDYGVVLEPTGLRTATSSKGLAWYEFTIEGTSSHASQPGQGENAILGAHHLLRALKRYDDQIRKKEDDLVGKAHSTITQFHAGTKENVVPENATITIDRRFLPEETASVIDDEIDHLVSEIEGKHNIVIDWERTRTYSSASISNDSYLANVFRNQSAEIANIQDDDWGFPAAADVRNFVNDANMEAITWGPGDLDQAHSLDECVSIEEATDGLDILEQAIRRILS